MDIPQPMLQKISFTTSAPATLLAYQRLPTPTISKDLRACVSNQLTEDPSSPWWLHYEAASRPYLLPTRLRFAIVTPYKKYEGPSLV